MNYSALPRSVSLSNTSAHEIVVIKLSNTFTANITVLRPKWWQLGGSGIGLDLVISAKVSNLTLMVAIGDRWNTSLEAMAGQLEGDHRYQR